MSSHLQFSRAILSRDKTGRENCRCDIGLRVSVAATVDNFLALDATNSIVVGEKHNLKKLVEIKLCFVYCEEAMSSTGSMFLIAQF